MCGWDQVESVTLIMDRDTNRFKGVALATYKALRSAIAAKRGLHERSVDGRTVYVDFNNRSSRKSLKGGNAGDDR